MFFLQLKKRERERAQGREGRREGGREGRKKGEREGGKKGGQRGGKVSGLAEWEGPRREHRGTGSGPVLISRSSLTSPATCLLLWEPFLCGKWGQHLPAPPAHEKLREATAHLLSISKATGHPRWAGGPCFWSGI